METEAQAHTMDYEPEKWIKREKERVIGWELGAKGKFVTSNARKCYGNEIEQSIFFPLIPSISIR